MLVIVTYPMIPQYGKIVPDLEDRNLFEQYLEHVQYLEE